eukprot:5820798-Pyramimonas_sp.AAC.1
MARDRSLVTVRCTYSLAKLGSRGCVATVSSSSSSAMVLPTGQCPSAAKLTLQNGRAPVLTWQPLARHERHKSFISAGLLPTTAAL